MKRKLRKSVNIFLLILAVVLTVTISGVNEVPALQLLALIVIDLTDIVVLIKYGDLSFLLEAEDESD